MFKAPCPEGNSCHEGMVFILTAGLLFKVPAVPAVQQQKVLPGARLFTRPEES